MNNNIYLIPANTKRGGLIFGYFRPVDLGIFLTGVLISILLIIIFGSEDITKVLLVLSPAFICTFLVLPVPNYHNMLVIILEIWDFFTTRQKFIWKGWCSSSGKE